MRFLTLLLLASLWLPTVGAVLVAPATGGGKPCCRMGSKDTACALRCARSRALGGVRDCPPPRLPVGSLAAPAPPALLPSLAWTVVLARPEAVEPVRSAPGFGLRPEPPVPPPRA